MIVRWAPVTELPGLLAEAEIERPFVIASPRWGDLDLPAGVGRWDEVPSARAEVPSEADGILAVGGGSAIDTGKYASGAERPAGRARPDDLLRRRVDDPLRDPHARPADSGRRRRRAAGRDPLRRRADARPAARRHCRHGAERARALRRGALRPRPLAGGRRAGARGGGPDRRRAAARARRRLSTARRAKRSCAGRCTAATRSASRASPSHTRWPRRSAAPTACPHGAMNALCLPPGPRVQP